jgi:hypothetical protein
MPLLTRSPFLVSHQKAFQTRERAQPGVECQFLSFLNKVGFNPSSAAAPLVPPITQWVASGVRKISALESLSVIKSAESASLWTPDSI